MIASARGLIVLGVITVSLAVAVLVGAPTAPITNRTLLPLFNPDAVSSITFSHAGKPDVGIILDEDTWRARKLSDADADFEVDRSTVEAALAALRGATWHRRAETAVANPTRGGIAVAGARGTIEVLIGREVPGSAQTWLVVWGQALLVDSWVAHALLPAALELRVRAPLASAPIAAMLRGPGVRVDGRFQTEPVKRWIAEPALNELVLALVDLTIVSLDGMHPAPAGRAL